MGQSGWKLWALLIFLTLAFYVSKSWPDGKLRIYFCDVGQGDGAVVTLGYFQAVVDTGAYEDKIVSCLSRAMPVWDREVEVVFLSHSDKDHAGAVEALRGRYKVGRVIDKPERGDVLRYGSLHFEIVKGSEVVTNGGDEKSNQLSVVMTARFRKLSVMFTGDIDDKTEKTMVDLGWLSEIGVLKVSHHGSKFGSTEEFLKKLVPDLAIISVGKKNNYGHPAEEVLSRLTEVGARILRTDVNGTIVLVSDGSETDVFADR